MKKKEYKMPQATVVAVSETELLVESPIGFGEGPGSGSVGAPERDFDEFDGVIQGWYDDIFVRE